MSVPLNHSHSNPPQAPRSLVQAAVPVIVAIAAVGLALATLHQPPAAGAAEAAAPSTPQPTAYSDLHEQIPQPALPEELPAQF